MIELTEDQVQAVALCRTGPVQVVNPRTREVFVLIRKEIYDLTSRIVSAPNQRGWDSPADDDLI
ncbi:MAG: hypothetical protein HY040_16210 [Planctomycetes bacterium]|nr:hypothetical protein [Planctomycetota bacterium]